MNSYSFRFVKFLLGLQPATTGLTSEETNLIRRVVSQRRRIAEIGVFEGVTSKEICRHSPVDARILLVDPYPKCLFLERLLGISFAETIARFSVRPWRRKTTFFRMSSLDAAKSSLAGESFDFIFIDADHSYDAVRHDFLAWRERLADGGLIGLHDSRCCLARPDLGGQAGPVLLVEEIKTGKYGAWKVLEGESRDTLTLIQRTPR